MKLSFKDSINNLLVNLLIPDYNTIMKNTLIQITQNGMGTGSEELGLKLITNYFSLLNEEDNMPKFITFYNSGVKLLCKNSPALDVLKTLEQKGIQLIACKTCLNHFELMDMLKVGTMGTMIDIIGLQKVADKVVNL